AAAHDEVLGRTADGTGEGECARVGVDAGGPGERDVATVGVVAGDVTQSASVGDAGADDREGLGADRDAALELECRAIGYCHASDGGAQRVVALDVDHARGN